MITKLPELVHGIALLGRDKEPTRKVSSEYSPVRVTEYWL